MASTEAGQATRETARSGVNGPTRARIGAKTLRSDRWWLAPLATFTVFSAFVAYATFRAFWGHDYFAEPYLSPFYSPCLGDCVEGASDFGQPFAGFPLSAALIILIFPLGFRLTCYYYRKAYYRSFWLSPPACAVAEPRARYTGETRLPLILQNVHRYFFYAALVISVINSYDAIVAFHSPGGFGFGLGNVILVVNVILLWIYTLSCHSCRHVTGGRLKHFSKHPVRYRIWTFISKLNTRHMQFAWITLGTLIITDCYIMLVASGTISDLRFVG